MATQPRIGVVLSSGGIRGIYAHTGFLQALQGLGIMLSAGAGCSAGAVVGGIAASGTDLHHWTEVLAKVRRSQFWTPDSLWRFLWNLTVRKGRGYTGLSGNEAAINFCRQHLTAARFEDCRYPFHAIAVSLGQNQKTIFSQGELAPRLVASAAMPVLYRPVEIDGDLYCDGALIELAPTEAICCKHGLDALIVHHVSQQAVDRKKMREILHQPWSMIKLLNRLLYYQRPWYLTEQPLNFLHCPCGCGAVVIVVEPSLPELEWPLTRGGAPIQTAARQQAQALLQPYVEALNSDPRGRLHAAKQSRFATLRQEHLQGQQCGRGKQETDNETC